MKKQIIVLLLFSTQLSAQNKDQNPHFPKVKITVPCNEDFINHYKGKWLIPKLEAGVNDFRGEVKKRLNQIHNLVYQTYPQPLGSDAGWTGTFVKTAFADEVKYVLASDGDLEKETVRAHPGYAYTYSLVLFGWSCNGENQIMNGFPEIGGASLVMRANALEILNRDFLEGDEWTIDGRPIKEKMPAIGKWKGYDVMAAAADAYTAQDGDYFVLIPRGGMLPYVSITRKQYLDRDIQYITRLIDGLNEKIRQNNEALPAAVRTSQEEIDHQTTQNTKLKNDVLKKLLDELEKTTKDGLLDAPAVVRIDPMLQTEGPIFLPEEQGGTLLATENPAYFRKDLPKYVPQFFVMQLSWTAKGWSSEFKRTIEDNFPVERLQEMIDK